MAKKNEMVKTNNNVPAFIKESNEGFENMRAGDMILPRMILMQALSPKVVDKKFTSGTVINSLTDEVVIGEGEKIAFVPIFHYLEWIEWGDKKLNEGIKGRSLDPSSALAQSAARNEKRMNSEGKEVWKVTEYHNFVCVIPEMGLMPIVISCSKTNNRKGKKLLSLAKMRGNYPLYAGMYSMEALLTQNKRNEKYYVYEFDNAGWVASAEELAEYKKLYDVLKSAHDQKRIVTDQHDDEELPPETEI